MRLSTLIAAIAFTLPFVPTDAHATFIGNTLLIEWHFPSLGTVIETETGTVGGGIEFVERLGAPNIDVDAATIDFFGANASSFASASFNGFVFSDTTSSIADFLGVSISSQSGYSGFGLGNITVAPDRIEVNFTSVTQIIQPNNQVQLTVTFVPEPGTAALLLTGLLGLVGYRRGRVSSRVT